jgi:Asp/Glu/hydantoin racemase
VSFAKALEPWFAEIVAWHGLSGRCAAIRTLDEAFRSIDDVQDEKQQVLVDLANNTVRNDAADVVILAGAPLAGMADKVKDRIPVPVVDGIQAAVTMAEGLVRLKPRKAIAGTYRRPAAKDSKGLSAALADVIAHRDP